MPHALKATILFSFLLWLDAPGFFKWTLRSYSWHTLSWLWAEVQSSILLNQFGVQIEPNCELCQSWPTTPIWLSEAFSWLCDLERLLPTLTQLSPMVELQLRWHGPLLSDLQLKDVLLQPQGNKVHCDNVNHTTPTGGNHKNLTHGQLWIEKDLPWPRSPPGEGPCVARCVCWIQVVVGDGGQSQDWSQFEVEQRNLLQLL
jgi:hypothetical protein